MRAKFILLFLFSTIVIGGLNAQTTITGTVTDQETGEALIGASVSVPGTDRGTITNLVGKYSLKVPAKAQKLRFSFTGYGTKEIKLEKANEVDVKLLAGAQLEEVVVIGYGTVKKSDATGAVETVQLKDKEAQQYDNVQELLQGRAKGVYVQSNGNELLSPNTVRVRGSNSLRGDNEPLYVVDGIIMNSPTVDAADPLTGGSSYLSPQNGLAGINPQDIDRVEILKDASATAIYGSRGANGVIIITTKKGQEGKAKFNYKSSLRVGNATRLYEMLDAKQFVNYQNEYRAVEGFAPTLYTYADGTVAKFVGDSATMETRKDSISRLAPVSWYDEIFQTAVMQSHNISVSGGQKKSQYYISGAYTDGTSIIPGTRLQNGQLLMNLEYQLSDRLTIAPRISASHLLNSASKGTENLGGLNTSIVRQIVQGSPFENFSENNFGILDVEDNLDGARAWLSDYDDDSKETRLLGAVRLDYKLSSLFTWRVLTGVDQRDKQRQIWYGRGLQRGYQSNGEAGLSNLVTNKYNIDNTLMFQKKLQKNREISGTVGVIFDANRFQQSTFTASNFVNQSLRYNGISYGQTFTPLRLFEGEESLLSFLGRVNYNLNDRFLFTGSMRADGSSKFSDGNKFSYFPAAAIAWKISNERFMRKLNWLTESKVRVGYGRTGSQAIKPYETLGRFGATANLLSDGQGGGLVSIVPLNLENPALIWETTDQANAGIDFRLKEGRYEGSFDVYYKNTSDLLQQLRLGPSAGFNSIVTNKGSLENRGVELSLKAVVLQKKVNWSVWGNISVNRNKIKNLGVPPAQFGNQTYSAFLGNTVSGGTAFKVPANIFIEGQPAGLFWGFETNGIIQTQEQLDQSPGVQGIAAQLGDVRYVDRNGDKNITDADLTVIGNPNPDFNYGFGSEIAYKRWSVNLFFNGVFGNDIANGNLSREDLALGDANNIRTEAYTGAWRPGRTDATHPRLNYTLPGDFTDRMIEDGSFTRLAFATLNYSLPRSALKGFSDMNLFVGGQNLLLFTKYSGFDPEVNSFPTDALRQGIDWQAFPNQKSFTFGLSANF
jgi:TonB-dependent starch-binding outer membrane protein SusC